jgi:hypothetical protein
MPTPESLPNATHVNLSDAPGGTDPLSFEALFPPDPPIVNPQTTMGSSPMAEASPAATTPGSTAPSEPFLKAPTGTVYNSREAAIEGISQKDALIEQLRQRYSLATGVDPITNRPLQPSNTPQAPTSYAQNPDQFIKDLTKSAETATTNPSQYRDTMAKFVMDVLEPIAPAITELSQHRAIEQVSSEIKDFDKFKASADYTRTLEKSPQLAQAISQAENDPRMARQLPEFYRLAYLSALGSKVPELVMSQQNGNQNNININQPIRTTTPVSTPAPPLAGPAPDLTTREGRKAIIAAAEAKGMNDVKW